MVLAACTSGTAASRPPTTPPGAGPQSAVTKTQSMLLGLTDLPAGWKSFSPPPVDVGPNAGPAAALQTCLQSDAGLFRHDRPGHVFVSTQTYLSPEYITLVENLDVAPNSAAADADFSVLAKPGLPACLAQAYGTVLTGELAAQGSHNVDVTASKGAPLAMPATGDRSSAFRAFVTLVNNGQPEYVYVDDLVFQVGSTTATLQFERVFSPVDAGLEQQLVNKAAARLTGA